MDSNSRKKDKCNEAIKSIIVFMKRHQIPIPSIYQRSRIHEDLPETTDERQEEVLRRLRYLEPQQKQHVVQKLYDLLAYADVAKMLNSEIISMIVLSKLAKWENVLLNHQEELDPPQPLSPESRERYRRRQREIEERDRKIGDIIRRYEEMGENRRATAPHRPLDQFGETARPIILPPQFIGPPHRNSEPERVDLEEQTRKIIDIHSGQGAIRKQEYANRPANEFGETATSVKLPPQFIRPPQRSVGPQRVDLEEQTRQLIDSHSGLGAIRKQVYAHRPEYEFGSRATSVKLPPQFIGPPSRNAEPQRVDLEEQTRQVIDIHSGQGVIRKQEYANRPAYEFGATATSVRLPLQFIGPPHRSPGPQRVDLGEQRRQLIDSHSGLGAIRKQVYADRPANEFGATAPSVRLPPQFIEPPHRNAEPHRVDLDEQRRQIIESHSEQGAIRKQVYADRPAYDFGATATSVKLPPQFIGPPHRNTEPQRVDLEEQRRQMIDIHSGQGAIRKRIYGDRPAYEFGATATSVKLPPQFIGPPHRNPEPQRVDLDEQTRQVIDIHSGQGAIRKKEYANRPSNEFGATNTSVKLPPQFIGPPHPSPGPHRVDLDEQRRQMIESHSELGAIRKRIYADRLANEFGATATSIRLPSQFIEPPHRNAEPPRVNLDEQTRQVIDIHSGQGAIRKQFFANRPANEFGETATSVKLPPQFIGPPHPSPGPHRVDLEEQRRQMIESHRELGAIRKLEYADRPTNEFGAAATSIRLPSQFIEPPHRNAEPPRVNLDEQTRQVIDIHSGQGAIRKQLYAHRPRNEFGSTAASVRLPAHFIGSPYRSPVSQRVDLEEKRRRDIEMYRKQGEIKLQLYSLPEYERDLRGVQLPPHALDSITTSTNNDLETSEIRRHGELEKRKEVERLKRELAESIAKFKS